MVCGCTDVPPRQERTIEPSHRQLQAMVLSDGQLVVVSLTGAKLFVDPFEPAFRSVVESLAMSDSGPRFTTPEGFSQETDLERNAIELEPESGEPISIGLRWFPVPPTLELSDQAVADLGNEARGRLGLPRWSGDWREAAEERRELAAVEGTAGTWTVFDFRGSRDPFIRFTDIARLPEIEWEPPQGWDERPKDEFRLAIFERPAAGGTLQLTVSKARGSVRANVDRWRGQAGLDPLSDDEETGESLVVDGRPAVGVRIEGEERAIRGVIVPKDDELIFVKLTGSPESVADVEDDFRGFVESLKLG